MVELISAIVATLVGVIFALSTYERWLNKKKIHELAWASSLSMFAIAAFALALGAAGSWNHLLFKVFYLFGAILNVPFLALGTVYLQFGEKIGNKVAKVLVLLAFLVTGMMISAPFLAPLPLHHLAQGSKVFSVLPRLFAGVGSGVGATVVFVGAIASFFRTNTLRFKVSNALIAIGTAVTGASGLLNSLANAMTAFSITLVIGITIIYFGFIAATTAKVPAKVS
ncbi:hypothetical protein AXFE_29560 [Acidithrix ferrooxidans]|uniref:Uncharacterized protein n=2 Tax=Acidimicrobiaceae TaxID=84994 RepID=A0A0D8HE74_9ACTN|nr:hypothetical protein AXFE_29560 [Acidithrix ferrooxidans]CAG4933086.1 unnamed protein product [Acidithrix sp. C25]